MNLTDWIGLTTIIVTVLVGLPALSVWWQSRKKKELSYEVVGTTNVLKINANFSNNIKISYKGLAAKTVQVLRFVVENTGGVDIKPEDFSEPITFLPEKKKKNGKSTGEYLFNFPHSHPEGLKPEVINFNERVGIKPLLLNKGDMIICDVLNYDIEKIDAKLDFKARIVGIKELTDAEKSRREKRIKKFFIFLFIFIVLFSLLIFIPDYFSNYQNFLAMIDKSVYQKFIPVWIKVLLVIFVSLLYSSIIAFSPREIRTFLKRIFF